MVSILQPLNVRDGRKLFPLRLYIILKTSLSLISPLSRQLQHDFPRALIFSTDDFFFREDGAYEFNPDFLEEAHEWNQKRGDKFLSKLLGNPHVHIDCSCCRMNKFNGRSLTESSAVFFPKTRTPERNLLRFQRKKIIDSGL